MSKHIAEVIESSTCRFTAEVCRDENAPAFGTWVRVSQPDGSEVFGLVSHVEIGSIEPGRRAAAFGLTHEELRKERPHVLELLRTTFAVNVLAHRDTGGHLRQTLPPFPADIHQFVFPCAEEEVRVLAEPYDFLRTLVYNASAETPVDELVIAVLRRLYVANSPGEGARRVLLEASRALSRLFRDDHERLQSILRRVA